MAAECSNVSEGFPPFVDIGVYLSYPARLYPSGNTMPSAHRTQGIAAANAVERLDAAGLPDVNGSVGLLVLGMSNANQETDYWEVNGFLDNALQQVDLVNGAVGGIGASDMNEAYFVTVDGRVTTAGLTNSQIQWIWFKTAEPDEAGVFPTHAETMQANIKAALEIAVVRYPNLKGVSFSSRVYGGYGDLVASPSLEPWAYEGGFAFKWLIEDQINYATTGDPDFDYDVWPWMGWGPYLWADGETPRTFDGLFYECADFQADGAHPDTGVKVKVDDLLNTYFTTSEQAAPWFYGRVHPVSTGSLADTTDTSQYTLALSGLLADTLQIVFVFSTGAGVTPNVPTLSGCGITWVQIATRLFNTEVTLRGRMTVFRGMVAAPVDGTLTVDFAGQTQTICNVSAMQCIGALATGTNGSGAVIQSASNSADSVASMTATLAAASTDSSIAIAAWATTSTAGLVPEDSWTVVHTVSAAGGRMTTAYENIFDATATGTLLSGTQNFIAMAIEVVAALTDEEQAAEETGDGIIVMGWGQ